MLIAQFSDTHIKEPGKLAYAHVDTAQMLRDAISHLNAQPQVPDLVLISGDLVDRGRDEEYTHLREILASIRQPYLLIPGNHDDRAEMRRSFPAHPWIADDGFWQFSAHQKNWPLQIIGLDTVDAGKSSGLLCDERLAWLSDTLEATREIPTLIMMHHPPFDTGIGHMDDIGLTGREALADILIEHPHIELVVCGHLHRNIRADVGGCPVMTCPSTAHTVQLDIDRRAPSMYKMEPPGYLLHWWSGHSLVSHHVSAVTAPGPYPFFDAAGALIQ
jgi:3',5'-cyclic-AMP phosphodiesterase